MVNGTRQSRLRDDEGIALVTVLGIMLVVTALAIGAFVVARQALHESQRVEDESRAFRAANSGLDWIMATYTQDTAFPITGTTPDGTYVITRQQLGYGEWKLISEGTGSDGTTETVTQRFFFMNLWEMNLAGVGTQSLLSGSNGLLGSSNIVGPFYMLGDLDISGDSKVLEGPLFVKEGSVTLSNQAAQLGSPEKPIPAFVSKTVPPNVTKPNAGVYVGTLSHSVPVIVVPDLDQAELTRAAATAIGESVDNKMGTYEATTSMPAVNYEAIDRNAATYTTIDPPNTGLWSRTRPSSTNSNYKFIGPADGTISAEGAGTTAFIIGGRSFGSWGPVSMPSGYTDNGVYVPAISLTGDGHTSDVNCWDDFAYDNVRNILYISGTVFVDGPVTFAEDMTYIGNGTIVANGPITIEGYLRPYSQTGAVTANHQGELNEWALGLATPTTITISSNEANNYNKPDPRDETPTHAGAFYAKIQVHFCDKILMRGSVVAGEIKVDDPNMLMVTNPLLPEYLPDSLPGAGSGLMMPTLWSRR